MGVGDTPNDACGSYDEERIGRTQDRVDAKEIDQYGDGEDTPSSSDESERKTY